LAILSFRLALTLASRKTGFSDTPSVQRIRLLKQKKDKENAAVCGFVEELYANNGSRLRDIIKRVETALRVYKQEGDPEDGLPAVIRTSIILNSPDVFLLLLYMAYKGRLNDFGNLVGLATWLHWFSCVQQKTIVDAIKEIVDTGDLETLKELLRELCEKVALMTPSKASEKNFLEPLRFIKDKTCDWASFEKESWYPFFDRIWSQRELVIFATRRYFNHEFQYDPAETKFLTGHNKPSNEPLSAALTHADAIASQPGKPQPPQFAPGSTALTFARRGSSFTANFLNTKYSTEAKTIPAIPNTPTA